MTKMKGRYLKSNLILVPNQIIRDQSRDDFDLEAQGHRQFKVLLASELSMLTCKLQSINGCLKSTSSPEKSSNPA